MKISLWVVIEKKILTKHGAVVFIQGVVISAPMKPIKFKSMSRNISSGEHMALRCKNCGAFVERQKNKKTVVYRCPACGRVISYDDKKLDHDGVDEFI